MNENVEALARRGACGLRSNISNPESGSVAFDDNVDDELRGIVVDNEDEADDDVDEVNEEDEGEEEEEDDDVNELLEAEMEDEKEEEEEEAGTINFEEFMNGGCAEDEGKEEGTVGVGEDEFKQGIDSSTESVAVKRATPSGVDTDMDLDAANPNNKSAKALFPGDPGWP